MQVDVAKPVEIIAAETAVAEITKRSLDILIHNAAAINKAATGLLRSQFAPEKAELTREMSEEDMLKAIEFAQQQIVKIIDTIEQLRTVAGKGPKQLPADAGPSELYTAIKNKYHNEFRERKLTVGKIERRDRVAELIEKVVAEFAPREGEAKYSAGEVKHVLEQLEERIVRDLLLEGKRLDGRGLKDVRAIDCEVGILPRVHGSALFQRGETQALVIIALGTVSDEQRVEGLMEEYSKKFMLDYNFPPSSVGEVKPIRGPGRREIGHGMLAERSLKAVLPSPEKFPCVAAA